jgi:hypothetical protein
VCSRAGGAQTQSGIWLILKLNVRTPNRCITNTTILGTEILMAECFDRCRRNPQRTQICDRAGLTFLWSRRVYNSRSRLGASAAAGGGDELDLDYKTVKLGRGR